MLVCAFAARAWAQPVIEPGRERDVVALFAPHGLGDEIAPGWKLWGIDVQRSKIRVSVRGKAGDRPCLVLRHPSAAPPDATRTKEFAVERLGSCPPAVARALASAVQSNERGGFWRVEAQDARVVHERTPQPPLRYVSWLLAALALAWPAEALVRGLRKPWRRPHRAWLVLGAVVLVAGITALLVPERLPVHEHNSFVARLDCARAAGCDRDPQGPAWLPTTYHLYGVVLRSLPYRLPVLGLVSLAFALVSLVLLYALVQRAFAQFERGSEGIRVGLLAVTFLVLQPAWYRIAVSGVFWPYSVCALLAAGLAGLAALRTGRFVPALSAAAFLAIASLGNMVFLTLIPLIVIGPLAWRPRGSSLRPGWRYLVALAVFAVAVAPQTMIGFRAAFLGDTGLLGDRSVGEMLSTLVGEFYVYLWDPRLSPVPLAVYLLLGIVALPKNWRLMLPFAYFYLMPTLSLSAVTGSPLGETYPVGFINAFPRLYPLSVFAALGASWLVGRMDGTKRRLALAVVVALPIVTLPLAREGLAFMTGSRVLERELVALSHAFEVLPPHDLLVEGPELQEPIGDAPKMGDPIAATFPRGEYQYVLSSRGLEPAPLVDSEKFLSKPHGSRNERVLLYVGTKLRSFWRTEISRGLVPADLERPALTKLRERYRLVPVHEFEVETRQSEWIPLRLGADRKPQVTLGFYWLVPK